MQRLQVPPRCVPPKVRQPLPELHAHVRDDGAQRRRLDEAALEEEANESALLASQAMRSKARAVREAEEKLRCIIIPLAWAAVARHAARGLIRVPTKATK